jgi:cell division protein FtsB
MPPVVILKTAVGLLALLVILLQGQLWLSDDGFREVFRLQEEIRTQAAENARLAERNQRLEAEVRQLREARPDPGGGSAVEERARADLGLIGPRESFYLFTGPPG